MYCKVTPIKTSKSVESLIGYIGNATHRNHHDKEVCPVKFWHTNGIVDVAGFALLLENKIGHINAHKKRGPKIANFADHEIIRFPDLADVSDEERQLVENGIMAAFPESPAASGWHIDKFARTCDLHIVRANFANDMPGRARRQSGNPIRYLRTVCDTIHDELNCKRSLAAGRHIETMPELHQRKLKERGLSSLSEQLTELPAVDWDELPAIITKLGHTVTRYNKNKKTVSVLFKNGRKACRYDIRQLQDEVARNRFYEGLAVPSETDLTASFPELP